MGPVQPMRARLAPCERQAGINRLGVRFGSLADLTGLKCDFRYTLDEVGPPGEGTTPRQSRMKFALLLLVDLLGMTLIGTLIVLLVVAL